MMKNVHIGWGPVGMTKIITKKSTKLKLNANNISLEMDATFKLSILSEYTETPVYESSNENVVTVDQEGNVLVVGYGAAYITVTSGELKGTCVIKVAKPDEPIIPEEPDVPVTPDEPDEPIIPEDKLDNTKMYYGYMPIPETWDGLHSITEAELYEAFKQGQLVEADYVSSEIKVIVPEYATSIVLLPNEIYSAKKNQLNNILSFTCDAAPEFAANGLQIGNFYLFGEMNISTEVELTIVIE
jgi:hypothetical protein